MRRENQNISNPDELNKILQKTNPIVWVILGIVLLVLVSLCVWAILTTLEVKVHGTANVTSQVASVQVSEEDVSKVKAGNKIYISDKEGVIASADNDGHFTSSVIQLADGEYDVYIVEKEIRPIAFLMGN